MTNNKETLNDMIHCIEDELRRIRLDNDLSVEEKFNRLKSEGQIILQDQLSFYQD